MLQSRSQAPQAPRLGNRALKIDTRKRVRGGQIVGCNAYKQRRVGVFAVAERFDQHIANELSLKGNLITLAGHYKGIDQRVRDHLITREISIGDFVLTGGELVAAMIADAVVRVVPGVIGDEQSALSDCFQDDLLAAPIYTRPADYKGWKVPDILLSGNEAKIRNWELEQAMERTRRLRPDLLKEE